MSKIVYGTVAGKTRTAPRRRAVKHTGTGKVYTPIRRGSGMHDEVTDPKIAASFLTDSELAAQQAAQTGAAPS